jgi:hypothetical protein
LNKFKNNKNIILIFFKIKNILKNNTITINPHLFERIAKMETAMIGKPKGLENKLERIELAPRQWRIDLQSKVHLELYFQTEIVLDCITKQSTLGTLIPNRNGSVESHSWD